MNKEINELNKNPTSLIHGVSNSFICDSCEKQLDNKYSIMLTDEWYVCKDCFEKESVCNCEYSSLCAYTGKCDESC